MCLSGYGVLGIHKCVVLKKESALEKGKSKRKKKPRSNSRLLIVTMRGHINPLTIVSKVAQKGKLYGPPGN